MQRALCTRRAMFLFDIDCSGGRRSTALLKSFAPGSEEGHPLCYPPVTHAELRLVNAFDNYFVLRPRNGTDAAGVVRGYEAFKAALAATPQPICMGAQMEPLQQVLRASGFDLEFFVFPSREKTAAGGARACRHEWFDVLSETFRWGAAAPRDGCAE